MENLKFKDITIDAKGMHDVGMIGGMTTGNIKNIELENITINGAGYVGGLVGNMNLSGDTEKIIENITIDNETIEATSNNEVEYLDITMEQMQ